MYRIAICDDDNKFAEELYDYIKGFCSRNRIEVFLKLYTDSDELMDMIENRKFYDLYILDIIMPAYSGMDLLEFLRIRSVTVDVILLTSYTDYAVDACGYPQVFRYIPKGVYRQRLEQALNDFFAKMEQAQGRKPYVIHNSHRSVKFYQEDVVYIYKDGKYTVFVKRTGEEERERSSLSAVYTKLQNADMIMLDRCYIVNLLYISRIRPNEVILENGDLLRTSRENVQRVKDAFSTYWGELI
ncbi:MAG: response regulator transcription factor [Lachnospiraceae bacterium]|nr:response regulator transcription factor [Lachnospiraceae bacterium]